MSANAQISNQLIDYHDTITNPKNIVSSGHSYYGGVHTPKGVFRILVIFAGFSNDWNQEQDIWPYTDNMGQVGTTFPNYVNQLFYNNVSSFSPNATDKSLSNYYYQMSMANDSSFKVLGTVFPQRINVPLDPLTASMQDWEELTKRVFDTIQNRYPNYNWGALDNRKNRSITNPNFSSDNRQYAQDDTIDYVAIFWRFNDVTNAPTNLKGIGNTWYTGYAGIRNYTFTTSTGNKYIVDGFTTCRGNGYGFL